MFWNRNCWRVIRRALGSFAFAATVNLKIAATDTRKSSPVICPIFGFTQTENLKIIPFIISHSSSSSGKLFLISSLTSHHLNYYKLKCGVGFIQHQILPFGNQFFRMTLPWLYALNITMFFFLETNLWKFSWMHRESINI